jgi:hypothetical protein
MELGEAENSIIGAAAGAGGGAENTVPLRQLVVIPTNKRLVSTKAFAEMNPVNTPLHATMPPGSSSSTTRGVLIKEIPA